MCLDVGVDLSWLPISRVGQKAKVQHGKGLSPNHLSYPQFRGSYPQMEGWVGVRRFGEESGLEDLETSIAVVETFPNV